jgi:NhaA family Na+:H+ antiporter
VFGGVGLGLVLGKPIGVLLATWLSLRLRVAALPVGLGLRHVLVLGVVAGVGFTMALFVAQLAFADLKLLAAAKLAVLAASAVSALLALALGFGLLPRASVPGAARSADEAERSTLA